jgi:anion-transporting  ArsA/GET3 family ATPase
VAQADPARSSSRSSRRSGGLGPILADAEVCVVAGAGGVGKTTTAAAIGLGMARRGKRVAVVTIDPAKRLAAALGVDRLENAPSRVTSRRLKAAGIEPAEGGELWAMTLDSRRTFDELIGRISPDTVTRDRVLGNRIYREISGAVAGSQEFTAIAKLHELETEGEFDLIVLDTPPSRNAIDFLDSPAKLSSFFDGRAVQILMRPAGLGMRIAGGGTGLVFAALKRVTGADFFTDLSDFFSAISGITGGFSERAHAVADLLVAPTTAFVVVAAPEETPTTEAIHLAGALRERGMSPRATIANRVHSAPGTSRRAVRAAAVREELGDELSQRVAVAVDVAAAAAERDSNGVERLRSGVGSEVMVTVPMLDGEVHDVAGLARIESALFD